MPKLTISVNGTNVELPPPLPPRLLSDAQVLDMMHSIVYFAYPHKELQAKSALEAHNKLRAMGLQWSDVLKGAHVRVKKK